MPESVPPSPPQRRSRSDIQRALSMPALAIATGTRPCAATAMESRANKAKNQTRKPTWSRHKKRLWLNSRSSKRSIKLWWVHHLSSIAMASPSINSMSQASKTNAPSPSGFPPYQALPDVLQLLIQCCPIPQQSSSTLAALLVTRGCGSTGRGYQWSAAVAPMSVHVGISQVYTQTIRSVSGINVVLYSLKHYTYIWHMYII